MPLYRIDSSQNESTLGIKRVWYATTDDSADLIFWIATDGAVDGFQFCFNKQSSEHSISWRTTEGYAFDSIPIIGWDKGTPISRQPTGKFNAQRILDLFEHAVKPGDIEASKLDLELIEFARNKLQAYTSRCESP